MQVAASSVWLITFGLLKELFCKASCCAQKKECGTIPYFYAERHCAMSLIIKLSNWLLYLSSSGTSWPFGVYHLRFWTKPGFGTLALQVKKRFLPMGKEKGPRGKMSKRFDWRRCKRPLDRPGMSSEKAIHYMYIFSHICTSGFCLAKQSTS